MNIIKEVNDKVLVLKIEGRLDTTTAPALEDVVKEISTEVNELVLDMANLEYISSAGLRVVLAAQKKMSRIGSMKLVSVCDTVMEVLEITGFADVLTIE